MTVSYTHLVAEGRCQRPLREGAIGGGGHEGRRVQKLEHGAYGGDVGLQEAVVDVVAGDVLRVLQQVVEVLLSGAEEHRLGQILLPVSYTHLYIQSQRRDTYGKYARLLVENGVVEGGGSGGDTLADDVGQTCLQLFLYLLGRQLPAGIGGPVKFLSLIHIWGMPRPGPMER